MPSWPESSRPGPRRPASTLTPARPTVHLADGRKLSADLVVGADGFRSVVRKALWGETPVRYSGQTCFRAIANFFARETGWLGEIQGKGIRFGPCPIDAMRTYWWAAQRCPGRRSYISRETRLKKRHGVTPGHFIAQTMSY